MGSIYKRGPWWWMAFKLPGGKRIARSTQVASSAPEIEARKVLDAMEHELATQTQRDVASKTSVAEYAIAWTAERKAAKQTNAQRDYDRLELHVLPTFGSRRPNSVTVLEVRTFVKSLRAGTLAPRTIRNIYGLLHRLFEDAVAEGLVTSNPCVLKRRDLPKKRDKDPSWRAKALFSREEAELLLSSPLIPLDRRVTYGLGLLGGAREGEVAAVRWQSFDRDSEPLPRILIVASFTRHNGFEKVTKTENPREMPVHPTLSRILKEWEERGFAEIFGREPGPGDLLVPNRHGGHRTDNTFMKGLARDLAALGLRHRRFHDTRRTFISLGRTDGANPAVLKSVTHDQVGDVFDQYTTFTLEAKSEAVLCLKLSGRALRKAALATGTIATSQLHDEEIIMATAHEDSTFDHGQGGTRTRLNQFPRGEAGVKSRGYGSGGGKPGQLRAVPRSNVATTAIESDLEAALADFREKGDRFRLAARLRLLLVQVRR